MADCNAAAGAQFSRADYMAECRAAAKTGLDCGKAVGWSESYDRCIRDMGEQPCSLVLDPNVGWPASCQGIILVP
jgi:hypothetical protein